MLKLSRLLAPLAALFVLAGCGGSSHHPAAQHRYLTSVGVQAHSPTFGLPPAGVRAIAPSAQPSVLMLDTTDSPVPTFAGLDPFAVAGYTSGFWPTYGQMVGHFRYVVSIAVNTAHNARCLDVEPGDATPDQVVGWYYQDRRAGFARPCFYASLGNGMGPIQFNLSRAGISRASYWLWDADWTYSPHLDAGYDATQWTDRYANRNVDGTQATLAFVGAAPSPPPGPSPALTRARIAARGKSLHAYYLHGCRQPVLTTGTCGQLAWRVDHFQKLIDTAHGYYPHCFGHDRNLGAAVCQIVRPAVAVWSRAAASSHRAECPAHTATCNAFRQRVRYFDARINRTLSTSRL